MDNENIVNQYVEYVEGFLKGLFSLGTWYEHTTGANLDEETHDELLVEIQERVNLEQAFKGSNDQ